MVQGSKTKAVNPNKREPYQKKDKTKSRKAAPKKAKIDGKRAEIVQQRKKLKAAVGRNIEEIMAARFIHEGGSLNVVKAPKDINAVLQAGGAKHGKKATKELNKSTANRTKRGHKQVTLKDKLQSTSVSAPET